MTRPSLLSDWHAARTHPHTYPGDHPTGGFAVVDQAVQPVTVPSGGREAALVGGRPLSQLLAERGLPPLGRRTPVLAYGGNRNPATLALKMQHHDYRSPGVGLVLPVLTARLTGFDVVGAALSAQGYLFGDLLATPATVATVLDAHVLLLDDDQLRVVHDSEGVRNGFYDVAALGGITVDGGTDEVRALAYIATTPHFVSPALGTPLAFTAVRATGRALPAFEPIPMLAHALAATGLIDDVRRVVGTPQEADDAGNDRDITVAAELMRYLNGQWWVRRHTGQPRIRACEELHALIDRRLLAHSVPVPRELRLAGRGEWLTADEAYATPLTLTG